MINPAPMPANGTKTHVPSASSSSGFLNADRGDILIRGFWEGSTDTIIDVRVTNLDSKSLSTQFFTFRDNTTSLKYTPVLRSFFPSIFLPCRLST